MSSKCSPPDDLARINKNRLATTYQIYYGKQKTVGIDERIELVHLSGDVYRPNTRKNISDKFNRGKNLTRIGGNKYFEYK